MGLGIGLTIGGLLYRFGSNIQFLQKRFELAKKTTGNSRFCARFPLRTRKLGNTIEERVSFTVPLSDNSGERIERKGILVRRPYARAVVLICHGFMCTKDDVRFLRGTIFNDYTTLSFDFRAHGECTAGQVCTFGSTEKNDVIGAVEFIRSQPDLKNKPIIVYGFSMGAVASLLAQAERGDLFAGAIWDCPFDSTDEIIRRMLNQLNISIGGYEFAMPGKTFLQKYAYNPYIQDIIKKALRTLANMDSSTVKTLMMPINTVEQAKRISIPAYFIVCKKDTKAPVGAVRAVYRATKGYKRLWITNGRSHFDSFFYNPEAYVYRVVQFIEKVIDGTTEQALHREKILIDEPADDQNESYDDSEIAGKDPS